MPTPSVHLQIVVILSFNDWYLCPQAKCCNVFCFPLFNAHSMCQPANCCNHSTSNSFNSHPQFYWSPLASDNGFVLHAQATPVLGFPRTTNGVHLYVCASLTLVSDLSLIGEALKGICDHEFIVFVCQIGIPLHRVCLLATCHVSTSLFESKYTRFSCR